MARVTGAVSKAQRKSRRIVGKAFKKTVKTTTKTLQLKKKQLRQREKRALKADRPISLRAGPHLIDPSKPFLLAREAKDFESTAIYYFDYDRETRTLLVQFWKVRVKDGVVIKKWPSNKKYLYPNIPPELYFRFLKAGSKGRFFLANIKGKDFKRL